jgi:arsenite oxidase small subunit
LVTNISSITGANSGQTVTFNYPVQEAPNTLMKLGVKAENGVGPDGDIVAFSLLCQHLGCIWGFVGTGTSPKCDDTYKAKTPVGYCCCHGTVYDLANGAAVTDGPAPRPVPQVILSYEASTGDIYATGMTPPTVFGFHTGSNNVLYDLQGGTPVS